METNLNDVAGARQHFLQTLTKPMPLIYFLRHGQTDYNAARRIQGALEIPINARGRAAGSPQWRPAE